MSKITIRNRRLLSSDYTASNVLTNVYDFIAQVEDIHDTVYATAVVTIPLLGLLSGNDGRSVRLSAVNLSPTEVYYVEHNTLSSDDSLLLDIETALLDDLDNGEFIILSSDVVYVARNAKHDTTNIACRYLLSEDNSDTSDKYCVNLMFMMSGKDLASIVIKSIIVHPNIGCYFANVLGRHLRVDKLPFIQGYEEVSTRLQSFIKSRLMTAIPLNDYLLSSNTLNYNIGTSEHDGVSLYKEK